MKRYLIKKMGNIYDRETNTYLPAVDNGTPEWAAYQKWLDDGNTPDIEE